MIEAWRCARCDGAQLAWTKPIFVADPEAPIAGTRVGMCETCAREIKEGK